jgi:hypothetical protein
MRQLNPITNAHKATHFATSSKSWTQRVCESLLSNTSLTSEVHLVTPELALAILEANSNNRPVSKQKIYEYASQIRKGSWRMNGQAIIISDAGILRDGQHRLKAVVEAGVPVEMLINSGVEDESYRTLDTGMKRTVGHVLSIEGCKNTNAMGGGIREYFAHKKGFNQAQRLVGEHYVSSDDVYRKVLEYGEPYINEMTSLARVYYMESRFLSTSNILGFILFLEELHPTKWKGFMDRVFLNVGLEYGTPEFLFASRARKEMNSVQSSPPYVRKALFIKAFNAHLQGKVMKQLAFDTQKETYPRFIGDNTPQRN